jgi:RNA polymerase sigma factor (sigma-70 family)
MPHALTLAASNLSQSSPRDEETARVARQAGATMTDFTALYQKYSPDVFRFALYLCGERSAAEDIMAETFVRAWTSPQRIEMSTVKGYLFTIARNLFLQELRKTSRRAELDRDPLDVRAGPHAETEGKAELGAVLAEMRKLPEMDRAVLLMRAVDGLPYEEIARVLGISLVAAKVKVHRARLALAGARRT